MHGQEVALVAEFRDERELVLDQFPYGGGFTLRPASADALLGQAPQVSGRCGSGRDDLLGVLVAQLVQREAAARRNREGLVEQLPRVDAPERRDRAQVTLAVGREREAGILQRDAVTDGRERVLQGAAAPRVHVHVPARDRRQPQPCRQRAEQAETCPVRATRRQLDGQPQAPCEALTQPCAFFHAGRGSRQPQQQAVLEAALEVGTRQGVAALGGRPAAARDQTAQGRITGPGGGQGDQPRAIGQCDLAAEDQRQAVVPCCDVGPDRAGHGTFIGDRQGGVAEFRGAHDQFLRVRGTPQEGEMAQAVQFGIGHQPNTPCSHQPPSRRR